MNPSQRPGSSGRAAVRVFVALLVTAAVLLTGCSRSIGGTATKAGGNVLSSQLDIQGPNAKAGFVSMVANCELEQSALQSLLYDLEAGMPFLFIDQLDIQVATASDGKLRFLLGVSGQWQGAK